VRDIEKREDRGKGETTTEGGGKRALTSISLSKSKKKMQDSEKKNKFTDNGAISEEKGTEV